MNRKWDKQTPLEQIGAAMRHHTLQRNEWSDNREYTKVLVSAEYKIEQEFKVS